MTDPAPGPPESAALAESLSLAFLTLLESLSPVERAAFLLREVFDYDYGEIAAILDKSEANCRQMVSRAKAHLAERRPRFRPTPEQHGQMLWQFGQALTQGDLPGLISLLTDDIVAYSDGGGQVSSATHPVYGPEKVARLYLGLRQKAAPGFSYVPAHANGQPVVLTYLDGKLFGLLALDLAPDGRICGIYNVVNPQKLRAVRIA
jgi:RNA polymerase sigma-70 factor (ECF subfamily)